MSDVTDVKSPLLSPETRTSAPSSGSPSAPNPSKAPAAAAAPQKPDPASQPPDLARLKPITSLTWGAPAGLSPRGPNDENLVIFRRALGINYHREATDSGTLEEGRKTAIGIYRSVLRTQTHKTIQLALLTAFLYFCYFAQIVIGAVLTAIGPHSARYETLITVLGALNTVIAGILALLKGSGQPQRVEKDRVGFRRLQDWIEETEALLAVGVIGRNRKEVGLLVESAFKRYNSAKMSVENNSPDYYANQPDMSDDMTDGPGNGSGKPPIRSIQ
ncbi:uncharacterized protein GGS25DRAFT_484917 [Hypoxylon fragiforme]|uniref:uncharacterized protein n=1 Tax=Hypoxylon fragiforme TaxID=63214 RepID=UPI0020C6E265|nr:uncharacterized protein GGS25DRAFT_484917 [Hypoxylon fragiforme]KAI2609474.1 hypothetical protein GGS25DRAFT_484917 [Hypoxylon fragiforme]